VTGALLDGLGPAGRQHHDRDVFCPRVGRQPLNEFPAIAIGHREIRHDHVGLLLGCADESRFASDCGHGAEALAAQYDEAHLPCVFMVVDHEHHRRTLSAWNAVHRELFF